MRAFTKHVGVTAKQAPPTRNHRPAVWEGILGAVFAMDDNREVRYFDHDWEGAAEFAGVTEDRDPRIARKMKRVRYTDSPGTEPSHGQIILWVRKS